MKSERDEILAAHEDSEQRVGAMSDAQKREHLEQIMARSGITRQHLDEYKFIEKCWNNLKDDTNTDDPFQRIGVSDQSMQIVRIMLEREAVDNGIENVSEWMMGILMGMLLGVEMTEMRRA